MPGISLAHGVSAERARTPRSGAHDVLARARAWPSGPRARYLLGVLLLAAAYVGVAQIGYQLQFAGPVAAIVWLPVGVAIAFLYIAGPRYWPGVVLGDLLANDYGALPFG